MSMEYLMGHDIFIYFSEVVPGWNIPSDKTQNVIVLGFQNPVVFE